MKFLLVLLLLLLLLLLCNPTTAHDSSWPIFLRPDGAVRITLSVGSPGRLYFVMLVPGSNEVVVDPSLFGPDGTGSGILAHLTADEGDIWLPARAPLTSLEYYQLGTNKVSVLLGIGAGSPLWYYVRCMTINSRELHLSSGACRRVATYHYDCPSATLADLAQNCPGDPGFPDVMLGLSELIFRAEIRYDSQARTLDLVSCRTVRSSPLADGLLLLLLVIGLVIWHFDGWPVLRHTVGLLAVAGGLTAVVYMSSGGFGIQQNVIADADSLLYLPVALARVGSTPSSLWHLPLGFNLILPYSVLILGCIGIVGWAWSTFGGDPLSATEDRGPSAIFIEICIWTAPWLLVADIARGQWCSFSIALLTILSILLGNVRLARAWKEMTWDKISSTAQIVLMLASTAVFYFDALFVVYVLQPLVAMGLAPHLLAIWLGTVFIVILAVWVLVRINV